MKNKATEFPLHQINSRFPESLTGFIPPRLSGGIPGWLKQKISKCKRLKPVNPYNGWEVTTLLNLPVTRGWLDHCGRTFYNGTEYFVSEPYGLTINDMRNVTDFCAMFDLDVTVHAASAHYPTACLRLMFIPREFKASKLDIFLQEPQGYTSRVI